MVKKKARPRVDRTEAIKRTKDRKEMNRLRNELAHRENKKTLKALGIEAHGHSHRPSVMVRLATRTATQLRMEG